MKFSTTFFFLGLLISFGSNTLQSQTIQYTMPEENALHEGTWLQWPHQYTYGMFYRNSLDQTWVSMTAALVSSEKVHIVAYNATEQTRITNLLTTANVPLVNVDFFVHRSDDVWVRDNGPIFVYDSASNLTILDWGFNGWGLDTPYGDDDLVPVGLSADLGLPRVDLSAMVLEGGAIELDGNGTMMATKTSVLHSSRNPTLSQPQAEAYLSTNLGITNFIWLDGVYGLEITDQHIDGFVKFANDSVIVTMNNADLLYWDVTQSDINILYGATDVNNVAYSYVYVPLTQNNVTTAYGNPLGYKGSYVNYYVGNTVVLVPNYNDPNDAVANAIIQGLYPSRTVIGIDVRNLYENGGMVHCVTQQQPIDLNASGIHQQESRLNHKGAISPNPANESAQLSFTLTVAGNVSITLFSATGQIVQMISAGQMTEGEHKIQLQTAELSGGYYTCSVNSEDGGLITLPLIIVK